MILQTPRLQLVAHHPQHVLALMEGTEQFEHASGMRAAEGLREFFLAGSEEIPIAWLENLRTAAGPDVWTIGVAALHRESSLVIGFAGFKGPPDDDGVVEIAYGIVPSYENQGYATEVAAALADFAQAFDGVRLVRAHTLPEANASTKVLTKCGFKHVGEVVDPEDGLVWRWER